MNTKKINIKNFVYTRLKKSSMADFSLGKHCQSRELLADVFVAFKVKKDPFSIQYNEVVSEGLWSLSHTEYASCIGFIPCDSKYNIQSLGVDIESVNRIIPEVLKKKYILDEDFSYNELTIWVVKEAIFKAISKVVKFTFDLSDILISKETFRFIPNQKIGGEFSFWNEKDFIIAGAIIR